MGNDDDRLPEERSWWIHNPAVDVRT